MRRWAALLAALLWPSLAWATNIGQPVQLGTANGTTTAVITTGADAPVGSLIVVVASVATLNVAVTSVVDSQLNCTTYTLLDNTAVASRPTVAVAYCANTSTDLASGQTITVTVASTDKVAATAFAVAGMSSTPADISGKQKNGATATSATSTSTGTLTQAYELAVGALALDGTSSAFTPGSAWTTIGGLSSANGSAYAAFDIVCVTTGVAFAPTWTTSRNYMSDVVSFKGASTDASCMSKTNTYGVLQYGVANAANATKINSYAVLQDGPTFSKINTYVVLAPSSTGMIQTFP